MKCSNCQQDGHNKATCKHLVEPDEAITISLDDDIVVKFAVLAALCSEVATGLGKGYVEGVYQQALCMELQSKSIRYVSEETMPIMYKGFAIGGGLNHRLDIGLVSYLPFIFELKAIGRPLAAEHHWQLVRYMVYKKQPYGAVVNFSQSDKGSLEINFIVNHEDTYYLYNPETQQGHALVDYGL